MRVDSREAVAELAVFFEDDGYVRGPIPERLLREGWRYHKGWEIRISLPDDPEVVRHVQELIVRAGFSVAAPFVKHTRVIQPIYGQEPVRAVLAACGMHLPV